MSNKVKTLQNREFKERLIEEIKEILAFHEQITPFLFLFDNYSIEDIDDKIKTHVLHLNIHNLESGKKLLNEIFEINVDQYIDDLDDQQMLFNIYQKWISRL